jgi:Bacteriophage T4-like portal protein (Gp20)
MANNSPYGKKSISKNNPKNKESPLYTALTRLFSGPIVNYRQQSQIRFQRRDLDRFKFTSASGQSFKKKSYNPFEAIQSNIMANQSRAERYSDFDQMEFMPEIASAMDIYADEMTTFNQFRPILSIDCKNEEIKQILHNLYYKTLNIEQNLYGWCRTMVKFGDFFLYLDMDEKIGVKSVLGLPSPEVERLEGEDETNPNYVQFQWNSAQLTFENWQIAHFRILGQDKYSPYGTSILEPARRIWRQLTLLEDAMMAYRIVRAPDRRIFKIDVGNVPPQDVEQYMQKIITQMKRNQIVDPTTGRVDLRYNPMSIDEDYFIPVRGTGGGTDITNLPGGAFTGDIDDVKYLRDKLFSALKIPQAYLARGEGAAEDKTMLAQKDIRFARTIQRLQRIIIGELEKIGMIHLYTLGFRNDDILKFSLRLHNPSKLAELQELEHLDKQLSVAGSAKEQGFSKRYIFENILKVQEEEFLRNQRELAYDASFTKSLETMGQGEAEGGGAGGGLGDLGAETPEAAAPTPEAGGTETPETPPATGETGKESPLLAAPARREDSSVFSVKPPHLSSGSKGKWYTPVASSQNGAGARQRSYSAQSGGQTASSSSRNIFKGMSGLNTLARGLTENEDYYEKDEQLLNEVQQKLSQMDNKLKKKDIIGENKDETQ